MAHLIDKDALVAEIEKWISGWTERLNNTNPSNPSFFEGGIEVGKHILSFLDTLEVKEVDLEKELSTYLEMVKATDEDIDFVDFAKHFFSLGLNVSSPLAWKDISIIRKIMYDYNKQVRNEMAIPKEEEYCKEVLKRFLEQKGGKV